VERKIIKLIKKSGIAEDMTKMLTPSVTVPLILYG
jgi:hypothetical protein